MCSGPVLTQPNFNKQFYLQTDASVYGVGTVLSQKGETSPLLHKRLKPTTHPIAYYSATFTPTERNYDIYEHKLLAIMKSLTHWRPYLGWTKEPFTILTDHANLQYWKSPKNLNRRTARWLAHPRDCDFEIHDIPSTANTPVDALPSPPNQNQGGDDNQQITVLPPQKFINATS